MPNICSSKNNSHLPKVLFSNNKIEKTYFQYKLHLQTWIKPLPFSIRLLTLPIKYIAHLIDEKNLELMWTTYKLFLINKVSHEDIINANSSLTLCGFTKSSQCIICQSLYYTHRWVYVRFCIHISRSNNPLFKICLKN